MNSPPDGSPNPDLLARVRDAVAFATPDRMAARLDPRFVRHPMARLIGRTVARKFAEGGGFIIFEAPPRHGKSWMVSMWTPVWFLHWFPGLWAAVITYGAAFSSTWGRRVRGIIAAFGAQLRLRLDPAKRSATELELTTGGGLFCTGIGGELTGRGFSLVVIDDPVKNAEEAQSEVIREKHWEWWQSTAGTRLEPGAVVIAMMTRWHEDDLIGRIKAEMKADPDSEQWEIVRIPAICEEEGDPLGRAVGDPLWPERYSLEKLGLIAKRVGRYFWAAMFQQRPAPLEGGIIERGWFGIAEKPARRECMRVRSWDFGGTVDGDPSAGVLIARDWMVEHTTIEDVVRVQKRPGEVEEVVLATAALDGPHVTILIQRDPGQAGIAQYDRYVRLLTAAGHRVEEYLPTGDKHLRIAATVAPVAQAGEMSLVRASWNAAFLDEAAAFPNGTHDDILDATASGLDYIAALRKRTAPRPRTANEREHDELLSRVVPGGGRRSSGRRRPPRGR